MDRISKLVIQVFVFLFPVLFLTITQDWFDFNKNILLLVSTFLLLVLFAIRTLQTKRLVIKMHPIDKPIGLLALSYILSTLFASPNPIEALLQPTSSGTLLALVTWYLLARTLVHEHFTETIAWPLRAASVFLSLITLINLIPFASKLPFGTVIANPSFTPAGTVLALTTFLGIMTIQTVLTMRRTKKIHAINWIVTAIIILGFAASLFRLFQPGNKPLLLPFSAGWPIAVENLKGLKPAVIGIGPNNFINAFTIRKPLTLNTNDFWIYRFSTSSSYALTLLTENGILGFVALLWLLLTIVKTSKKPLTLVVVCALFLLIPINMELLFIFFLLLIELTSHKLSSITFPKTNHAASDLHAAYHEEETNNNTIAVTVGGIMLFALAVLGMWFTANVYRAELLMTEGVKSTATTDNKRTYEKQKEALLLAPYNSSYNMIFSRTTLALANLVAQKENPADADKKAVSDFVTQSVATAKAAVQYSPSVVTWENLAQIYTNLVTANPAAAQWTATAYQQALMFDPNNALLRVAVGGFYYSLKQYELAAEQFKLAITIKNNYANAWYNFANTARELGKTEDAKAAYQQVLSLTKEGTTDYDRVTKEMEALPEASGKQAGTGDLTTLTQPPATPSSGLKTPVELPQESAPEITVSPTPKEATEQPIITPETSPTATP